MSDLQPINGATTNPFDAIRRVRADGSEYWSARELAEVLKYDQWRNFATAIGKITWPEEP